MVSAQRWQKISNHLLQSVKVLLVFFSNHFISWSCICHSIGFIAFEIWRICHNCAINKLWMEATGACSRTEVRCTHSAKREIHEERMTNIASKIVLEVRWSACKSWKLITIFMIMHKTMNHFTLFICHCTSQPNESSSGLMCSLLWCHRNFHVAH